MSPPGSPRFRGRLRSSDATQAAAGARPRGSLRGGPVGAICDANRLMSCVLSPCNARGGHNVTELPPCNNAAASDALL